MVVSLHPSLYCRIDKNLNLTNYSVFIFLILKHLRAQHEQHFSSTHRTVRRTVAKKPMTSRLWYWNQFKSCAATRRCCAPWCLMTNSVQKTARSSGGTGRSWFSWDSVTIFSL